MKIAVFCSANAHLDPAYYAAADELGQWIGREGHTLVFGGTNLGLMDTIAQATHGAGGQVVGVVPRLLEQGGRLCDCLDVDIPCQDLTDRKQIMIERSDVFIALPGGLGTLDEVFSVVALHTLGYHQKRTILYNISGFWDAAVALLDDMQQRGCIRGQWTDHIDVVSSLDELVALI